jgi:hypothetical protein
MFCCNAALQIAKKCLQPLQTVRIIANCNVYSQLSNHSQIMQISNKNLVISGVSDSEWCRTTVKCSGSSNCSSSE